jgi:succinate dehydrogenase / fumarate reductase flavoprotein subunit
MRALLTRGGAAGAGAGAGAGCATGAAHEAANADVASEHESPRLLQRALRDLMTEHAGVVRSEAGLREGLAKLDALEARVARVSAHPDIAGFDDLAHAFDLYGSMLAARATLECALERRETRGCHNRSDYPEQDDALRGNFVWSPDTGAVFEPLPEAPESFRALAHAFLDDSVEGKLVE